VVNALALATLGHPVPVLLGAVVPDVPIAVLYAWERRVRGTPEAQIWAVAYQRPGWQAAIHGAHSLPLTAAGALLAVGLGAPGVAAFFASMFLHACADVPVHAEDAHRHFVPLSNWRFVSPWSYWDVRRHARVVAAVEAGLVALATALCWARFGAAGRWAALGVVGWYVHGYARTFLRGDGRWQPYF
jgi:hypothetical protein